MRYVLVGLAALVELYGLHRVAVWAEGRGWIYYRTKQGSSGALGNAFLAVQANIDPSAKYVLEERMNEDLEAEEAGDPPDPGKGGAVAAHRFSIQILGNAQMCRTEAEICVQGTEFPWAIVYEDSSGWKTEVIGTDTLARSLADEAISAAKAKLAHYVNRRGISPPAGLSAAGLSLWLMEKDDGTAMGRPT